MNGSKSISAILVGVFVGIGLLLTIATAIWLGLDRLDNTYPVQIHVNDAGGVKKGAPVEFGGIRVGRVAKKPYFKNDYTALLIPLAIDKEFKIPQTSVALIDRSDDYDGSYVKITMPEVKPEKFIAANDILNGMRIDRDEIRQKGLEDTIAKFQKSMESLDTTSTTLEKLITMLGDKSIPGGITGVGPPGGGSLNSVNRTMESLEETNQKMSKSIDRFDSLLINTGGSLEKMEQSMARFDHSMAEITEMANNGDRTFQKFYELADQNTGTTRDLQLAIKDFRCFMSEVNPLLAMVKESDGLLKSLVVDEELDADVRNFVDKAERHGMVFYPRERKMSTMKLRNGHSVTGRW